MTPTTITQEELKAARTENPGQRIEIATVDLDDFGTESVDVLIKAPSRQVVNEYEKWNERDPNKGRSILIRGCVLAKELHEQIEAHDHVFYGLPNAIVRLLPIGKARIKNF